MPEPRGMRHEQAAHYVGMKLSKFYEIVKDGRMAKPKRVDGCTVWDRFSLEMAFENLPDENETNPWDEDGS
ncbi:MAG: hypothetical protein O7H40_15520 [Gammaproteobacteria bacterium]|nr:hypothetical protein [Gammaproteobacteria bacterium]